MVWKIESRVREIGNCRSRGVAILNRTIRVHFTEKVTFEKYLNEMMEPVMPISGG